VYPKHVLELSIAIYREFLSKIDQEKVSAN